MTSSKISHRIFSYQVTGGGAFPLDMLRYDASWPRSTEDAYLIEESIQQRTGRRTIALTGVNAIGEPTVGRWDSFNWKVSAVQS